MVFLPWERYHLCVHIITKSQTRWSLKPYQPGTSKGGLFAGTEVLVAAILARSVFPRDWYSINVLHIPDVYFPGFTCLNFPPLSDFRLSEINNLLLSCAVRSIESRWEIPIDFSWKAWCLNSFFLRKRLRLSTRNLTAPLEVRKRSQLLFLPYISFRKSARILVEIYHTLEITSSSVLKRFQMKAFQKILKHS